MTDPAPACHLTPALAARDSRDRGVCVRVRRPFIPTKGYVHGIPGLARPVRAIGHLQTQKAKAAQPPQASLELVRPPPGAGADACAELEPDIADADQQGARERPVVRAVRKPAEASDSYTAADIEVLEGLEPVRRRPGMYVGGTDEKALHHLFAEVIDNAMDEAVAGHATWIEVELEADGFLTVTDNGRGIPVDPHPKFKTKSALEVIMTTLHSGGKFDSKVYNTSRRPARRRRVGGQRAVREARGGGRARPAALRAWTFARGAPQGKLQEARRRSRTGAAPRCASSPTRRSSARAPPSSRRACSAWRARRPTCSAASRSAGSARQSLITDDTPAEGRPSISPAASRSTWKPPSTARRASPRTSSPAASSKEGGHGSVEWAVCWVADEDGFLNSYCNTIPTAEGGTHENGLRSRAVQGPARLRRARRQQARRQHHRRRRAGHGRRHALGVHPRARVPGPDQGQARHPGGDPHRRERGARRLRPLAGGQPAAGDQAARLGRRPGRGAPQAQAREGDRPPDRRRASCGCPASSPTAASTPSRAPRSSSSRATRAGGSAKQARDRETPGHPAAARQDPQRRQRLLAEAVAEPAAVRPDPGAGRRHRQPSTATRTCATSA